MLTRTTASGLAVVAVALGLAACGDDSASDEKTTDMGTQTAPAQQGGPAAATAFIGCFDGPGAEAIRPSRNEASILSALARTNGFPNTPVNIVEPGGDANFAPKALMVFFADPAAATAALRETNAQRTPGLTATSGPVVIAYSTEEERRALEPAVKRCLG